MSEPPSDKERCGDPASPRTAARDATPRAATPVTVEVVVVTQNIAPPAVVPIAPMTIPVAMEQNDIPAGMFPCYIEVEHTHGIYSPANPSHISPTFHNNNVMGAPGTINTVIRARDHVAEAGSAPAPKNSDYPINTIIRTTSAYPSNAIKGTPTPALVNITPRVYERESERESERGSERESEIERARRHSPAIAEVASRNVNGRLPPHSIGVYIQPAPPQPPPPPPSLYLHRIQTATANHPPINTIVRGPGAPKALVPAPNQPLNQETGTQTHPRPPPGPLMSCAPPGQYISPFPPRTESPYLPHVTLSPASSAALAIAPKAKLPLTRSPRIPAVLSSAPLAFASYRNAFPASGRSTSALSSAAIIDSKPASPASLAQPPKHKRRPKSTTSTSTNKSPTGPADPNSPKVTPPKDPNAKEATVKAREKPHTCPICFRSFARTEHLQRHGLSHTKEKPFECKECGRSFARRDLLVRHAGKLHNGEGSKRIQGRYLGLGNRYSGNEGSRGTSLGVGGESGMGSGANTPGSETRPLAGMYYGLGAGPGSGISTNRETMARNEPRASNSGTRAVQEAREDSPPRPQRPLTVAEQYLAQSYGTNYVPQPSSPEVPSSPDLGRGAREFVPGLRKVKREQDAGTQSIPEGGNPLSPRTQRRNIQKRPPVSDEVVGDSDYSAADEQTEQPMAAPVANMGQSVPARQGSPTPGQRRASNADQYYVKPPVIPVVEATPSNHDGSALEDEEEGEGESPTQQLLREADEADEASSNEKDDTPAAEEVEKGKRKRKRSSKVMENEDEEHDGKGGKDGAESPPPKRLKKLPKKAKPNVRIVKKRSATSTTRPALPQGRTSSNSLSAATLALSPAAAAFEAFARSGAKRPPKSIRDLIDFNAPPVSARRSGGGNGDGRKTEAAGEASHIIAAREGRGPWSQSHSPEQAKDKVRRKSKHSFEMVEVDSSDEEAQTNEEEIAEGAGGGGKAQDILVDEASGKIETFTSGKGHERKRSLPKALRDVMDFNAAPFGRSEMPTSGRRARRATMKVLENASIEDAAIKAPKRRGRPPKPRPSEPEQDVEGEEEVDEEESPLPAPRKRRGRPPKRPHFSPSSSLPPTEETRGSPRDKQVREESGSAPSLVSTPPGRLHRGVQRLRDKREIKTLQAIENGQARKTRGGARAGSRRTAKNMKQQEAQEEFEDVVESEESEPAPRPVKRRGRQPKKVIGQQVEIRELDPKPAAPPAKRRGRPPKVKIEVVIVHGKEGTKDKGKKVMTPRRRSNAAEVPANLEKPVTRSAVREVGGVWA